MTDILSFVAIGAPLAAVALIGLAQMFGGGLNWRVVQNLSFLSILVAFGASGVIFYELHSGSVGSRVLAYEWASFGETTIRFGFLIDKLSVLMMLLVTGFSAVICRFAFNYMHYEKGFARFFLVYTLFVPAMLLLVMADNLVLMFIGWEAVGVCSYLLIGFYQERESAAKAGTEAFIANRVGDAAYIVALIALLASVGQTDLLGLGTALQALPSGSATPAIVAGGLLIAAMAKSAQFPLGGWLGKAMEGPTPSSALFYGSVMVTAGIYLLVRTQAVFALVPTVQFTVALVGALTIIASSLSSQATSDIKGILANSSATHLGFMFLACGLGAYGLAVFHLVAHAFFKAYQFISAPSILHHLHGHLNPKAKDTEGDASSIHAIVALVAGALVVTALLAPANLAGALALEGMPASVLLLVAGGLLALSSVAYQATQLAVRTFHHHDMPADAASADTHGKAQLGVFFWPLSAVASVAVVATILEVFPGGLQGSWFQSWLSVVSSTPTALDLADSSLRIALAAILALMVAYAWFSTVSLGRFRAELSSSAQRLPWLYSAALNRLWIEALLGRLVVRPVMGLSRMLDRFDRAVVAGVFAALGRITAKASNLVVSIEGTTRAAAEESPANLALHLGRITLGIERLVVNGFEWFVAAITSFLGRLSAGVERTMAHPVVAVAVIGAVLALTFLGAK